MFDSIKYVVGENKVSFGQNASGTWKCNEISINCKDVIGVIKTEMKEAIKEANKLLSEFNAEVTTAKEENSSKKKK